MDGKQNLFLCGVGLLILLIGSSKANESSVENDIPGDGKPKDCSDHLSNGKNVSGVYTIFLNSKSVNVYCDMDTDGGGWTVIQRRGNFTPQENFNRKWDDYKQGFGKIEQDFWLGNDNIYFLGTQTPVEIRFDLADVEGDTRYAKYENFRIDDESMNYTLHISGYSGNAGDGMQFHDGQGFSTKDRGNYEAAKALKGSWWIFDWAFVHLNGFYDPGADDYQAIHWFEWLRNQGLAFSEMKVRQNNL